MDNYIPFLKLKVNEVGALRALEDDEKSAVTPFFDLPRKDGMTAASFQDMVEKAVTSVERNLNGIDRFFLDNFDIDDRILVGGRNNYDHVITAFSELNFIPVIGLDRAVGRNDLVFDHKRRGTIQSDALAVRLQLEDFENFDLIRGDLEEILAKVDELFDERIIILDNRVCVDVNPAKRARLISAFLADGARLFGSDQIIVTGSSIPSSIRDVLSVESDVTHGRVELEIFRGVARSRRNYNIWLGDYTIVSPLYSEISIPPEAMLNVMAPKIIYTHDDVHYVARGGALKTHARKNLQYNDIAAYLVTQSFFRGEPYSFGDAYLAEKARYEGSKVTPSSILKPTINTHITYMLRDFIV